MQYDTVETGNVGIGNANVYLPITSFKAGMILRYFLSLCLRPCLRCVVG